MTTQKKEDLLTTQQICNEGKFHPYFRKFIEKKYKGKSYLLMEWKKLLKSDGLNF